MQRSQNTFPHRPRQYVQPTPYHNAPVFLRASLTTHCTWPCPTTPVIATMGHPEHSQTSLTRRTGLPNPVVTFTSTVRIFPIPHSAVAHACIHVCMNEINEYMRPYVYLRQRVGSTGVTRFTLPLEFVHTEWLMRASHARLGHAPLSALQVQILRS